MTPPTRCHDNDQASVIKSMQASIDRARHEAEAAKQQLKVREPAQRVRCGVRPSAAVPDLPPSRRLPKNARRTTPKRGSGWYGLCKPVACCGRFVLRDCPALPVQYTVRAIAPAACRVCASRVCAGDWHAATA